MLKQPVALQRVTKLNTAGLKQVFPVRQARILCPKIKFVQAKHEKYVAIHNAITKIIHKIIFVDEVLSIDEMYGRLPPKWQSLK